MKQQVSGREMIQEVELEEGRGHPGQKSWILKFKGINTVDQVREQCIFVAFLCFYVRGERYRIEHNAFRF